MSNNTLLKLFSVSMACGAIFVSCPGSSVAQTLKEDLQKLERLRDGLNTPLDVVDRLGEELLKMYSDPRDRGQIYYKLAFVHGQGGLVQPEKLIEYAKKAMQLPLEGHQRLKLFIDWGCAETVGDRNKPIKETRRSAVKVYLDGLRECLKLKLPEKAPELPPVFKFEVAGDPKTVAAIEKRHQAAVAARRKAETELELVQDRDSLKNQVVGLYTRHPFDTEELTEIATKKLQNPKVVSELVGRVKSTIEAMPKPSPIKPNARKTPSAAKPPRHTGLYFVWNIAALIVLVLCLSYFAVRIGGWVRARSSR